MSLKNIAKIIFGLAILFLTICSAFWLVKFKSSDKPQASLVGDNKIQTTKPQTKSEPELPKLSLNSIFDDKSLALNQYDQNNIRTIIATGDIIPARYTDATIRKRGNNFLYPVEKTKEITKAADLTVSNLEAPLLSDCLYHEEGFTFCGQAGFVEALKVAGIDLVTLENNHIGNYGVEGVAETEEVLDDAAIAWADSSHPYIKNLDGVKFGFVAFNGVTQEFDREALENAIKELDLKVDVLIAALHWGGEYSYTPINAPGVSPDDPQEIAHLAIDAGADLIIGNHPHWVQAVELYKDKLITYAHGNFIFDQMWSYETRVGVIGKYTFYQDKLIDVKFIPVLSENYAQPVIMEKTKAQETLQHMLKASKELQ